MYNVVGRSYPTRITLPLNRKLDQQYSWHTMNMLTETFKGEKTGNNAKKQVKHSPAETDHPASALPDLFVAIRKESLGSNASSTTDTLLLGVRTLALRIISVVECMAFDPLTFCIS
jgi:hypothetical protein